MSHKAENPRSLEWAGKTVARVVYDPRGTHVCFRGKRVNDGNLIIIVFTDGTEVSFCAAADSMDVVWATVSPNDQAQAQPPTVTPERKGNIQ